MRTSWRCSISDCRSNAESLSNHSGFLHQQQNSPAWGRTYVSSLERDLENPTVTVLDKLAAALSISLADFFRVPSRGERPPQPLSAGRRRNKRTNKSI
ncbi:helix-turn-helix transcriptional regulator [Bradyrhizobium japonicum]|nr:helix-turn-helix transcriptional regulator [Bradyrhizobium japonicum]